MSNLRRLAGIAALMSLLLFMPSARASSPPNIVETFAGGGHQDGVPALQASLSNPTGLAVDASGNIFIGDHGSCRVREVDAATNTLTTVAGLLNYDYRCHGDLTDGISALAAGVHGGDVAVDNAGTLYIADINHCRVQAVVGGIISTVVNSSGNCDFNGDGPAVTAHVHYPSGLFASGTDLYIADSYNCRIRKLSGGVLTTVVGNGMCGLAGDNGPALSAKLNSPMDVAIGPAGEMYIADEGNDRIRKVVGGVITTVNISAMLKPGGVAVDADGSLYAADNGHCRIRKVSAGVITTFAGSGGCAYSGDGGPAANARLSLVTSFYTGLQGITPSHLDVLGSDLYIADTGNCRIRKVSAGTINTVVGDGSCQFSGGDGGLATEAGLHQPNGMSQDADGAVYVVDGLMCRVRRIANGVIETVAGNGTCAYNGDHQAATTASLNRPSDVLATSGGDFYISDTLSCRIRKVAAGQITTVVGNNLCGYNGEGLSALSTRLTRPGALAMSDGGTLYFSDSCRVRKVSGGIVTTVAGTGDCQILPPENGPAISAHLDAAGLAVDHAGNLYIGDATNCRVRRVDAVTQEISTIVGRQPLSGCFYGGENVPATEADINLPFGVAVDAMGHVYVAEYGNCMIREVSGGIIKMVVGIVEAPGCVWNGDGRPPTETMMLQGPADIIISPTSDLYFDESQGHRVRVVRALDSDHDDVLEVQDNCPFIPNADQANADGANPGSNHPGSDLLGDACDPDIAGDGYTNEQHVAAGKDPTKYCPIMRADVGGDGSVGILDMATVAQEFLKKTTSATERYNQDADNAIGILDLANMSTSFLKSVSACP